MVKIGITPRWRETHFSDRGRALCVALTPSNVLLRMKGTRTTLKLPWGIVLVKAAAVEASALRMQRIQERRLARKAAR